MPKPLVSSSGKMISTACHVLIHWIFVSIQDLQGNGSGAQDVMISVELCGPGLDRCQSRFL